MEEIEVLKLRAKAKAKAERERAMTKPMSIRDDSKSANVPWQDRMIIKNLSQSPDVGVQFLKSKGMNAELVDGEIYVDGNPLDPKNRTMLDEILNVPMWKDGQFVTPELPPPSDFTELAQDIGDIAYDAPAAIGTTGAGMLAGAGGAIATAPSGGWGAIPASMAASGVVGGAAEYLRQRLGQALGLPQEPSARDVGIATAVNTVAPAVFGTGLQGTKMFAPQGVNLLKGQTARLAQANALEQAQRSLVTRGAEKTLPVLASATSGIPAKNLKIYWNEKEAVDLAGLDTAKDAYNLIQQGKGKLRSQAETELRGQYPKMNTEFNLDPVDYYGINEQVGNARINLENKLKQGAATRADYLAAEKEAEAAYKAELAAAKKQSELDFKMRQKAIADAIKERKAAEKEALKLERQRIKDEYEAAERIAAQQDLEKSAAEKQYIATANLQERLGEASEPAIINRLTAVHEALVETVKQKKTDIGMAMGRAMQNSKKSIATADLFKPIDEMILNLEKKAITPDDKAMLEAFKAARKNISEGLPERLNADQAFYLQDKFRNNASFRDTSFGKRFPNTDVTAEKAWKTANSKAYGETNKKLEEVAGTQGLKDQYRSIIKMEEKLDNSFSDPETMYKTIASSDKPDALFTRAEMDDVKNLTGGQIDLANEITNIKDLKTLSMPAEKLADKNFLKEQAIARSRQQRQYLREKTAEYINKVKAAEEQGKAQLGGLKPTPYSVTKKPVNVKPTMTDEELQSGWDLLAKTNRMYPDQFGAEKTISSNVSTSEVDDFLKGLGIPIDEYRAQAARLAANKSKREEAMAYNQQLDKIINDALEGKSTIDAPTPGLQKYLEVNEKISGKFDSPQQTWRTLGGWDAPTNAYAARDINEAEKLLGSSGKIQRAADLLRTSKDLGNPGPMPISSGGVTSTSRTAITGGGLRQMLGGPWAVKKGMDIGLGAKKYLQRIPNTPLNTSPGSYPALFSPWVFQGTPLEDLEQ